MTDLSCESNRISVMQKWLAAFAWFLYSLLAIAQDHDAWRFWTRSDGLQESYSYSLGLGPGGLLTVRHGAVPFMTVLDGYEVVRIPEPYRTDRVDGVTRGRATPGADGSTWGGVNG